MTQANDHDQRVFEQFAQLRRRLTTLTVLFGLSGIALVVGAGALADPASTQLLGVSLAWLLRTIAVVVVVILTALWLWYWRCPACGKNMGSVWFVRHCPRCGVQLRR